MYIHPESLTVTAHAHQGLINPRRACAKVTVVNPRRACARVTVVAVCVYPSVTALAASASV